MKWLTGLFALIGKGAKLRQEVKEAEAALRRLAESDLSERGKVALKEVYDVFDLVTDTLGMEPLPRP